MSTISNVVLPIKVDSLRGEEYLYDFRYKVEGIEFSFYAYAKSFEDANKKLQAMKETLKVHSQIVETYE